MEDGSHRIVIGNYHLVKLLHMQGDVLIFVSNNSRMGEEFECRAMPLKMYREMQSPHLTVDGHEHIDLIKEVKVRKTHT